METPGHLPSVGIAGLFAWVCPGRCRRRFGVLGAQATEDNRRRGGAADAAPP